MNLAPQNLQQVALCYALVIIFPTNLEMIYQCTNKCADLESTFIKILNPKKTNMIVACIYRHPHMDQNKSNDYYINNLLDKLSKENKTVFHLGDFDIDLLNYDRHSLTNEFLDSLSPHMLLPHIVQPTRIRNNSKTLIDDIYSNTITPNNILGNITATVSDHLPQFCIAPDIFSNPPSTKFNTLKEIGPSLIRKNLFLTIYLQTALSSHRIICRN